MYNNTDANITEAVRMVYVLLASVYACLCCIIIPFFIIDVSSVLCDCS